MSGVEFDPLLGQLRTRDTQDLVYNVRDYGATGNGTTDDTTAFNNTLTAGAGATVYIPSGTYALTPGVLSNIPTGTKVLGAGIGKSIVECISGFNGNNNLIQIVSVTDVEISGLTIDGNKANNTNFQYGLYISTSSNCSAHNLQVQNWNGDGVQLYNCTTCMVHDVFSTENVYHGFEVEQCVRCTVSSCRGYNNTVHGIILTPGEVGSTGSQGNHVIGCSFDNNATFGICVNWDNASTGAHLSEGNIFVGNSVVANGNYGITLYGESLSTFTENYIYDNGFYGLYGYQSAQNIIKNNYFHNNSQAANNTYDEIYFEGSQDGYASSFNQIISNIIIINGTNQARYAYNERSGDGSNIVMNNVIPNAGATGTYNIPNSSTTLLTVNQGIQTNSVAVAPDGALPGSEMGIDAPFGTAALRLYNPNSGGNIQVVAPNGNAEYFIGGNDVVDFVSTGLVVNSGYGFKLATSPTSNYPLVSDASGNGSWQILPVAGGGTGSATQNFVDLTSTQTVGGAKSFTNTLTLEDPTDNTKKAIFGISGITTGTTATYTMPGASTTIVGTAGAQTINGNKTFSGTTTMGSLTQTDGTNITFGTTTGTQIGTATTQKLSFYGVTPVVQQAAANDLGTTLSNLGLRVSGATYGLTTSGTVTFNGTTNLNNGATIPLTKKLSITTGTNASAGTGTLAAGTVTISTTVVTASSLIFLTDTASTLTNVGTLSVSSKSAGASFTVTSSNVLDTSTFNWLIVN